jgi:hypothetical protein
MIDGDFKPAFLNNKAKGIARSNGDSFLSTTHSFETFVGGQRDDLPRFSILSNYPQIMKIMHANYIKSTERDALYKNRDTKDLEQDEEYA